MVNLSKLVQDNFFLEQQNLTGLRVCKSWMCSLCVHTFSSCKTEIVIKKNSLKYILLNIEEV